MSTDKIAGIIAESKLTNLYPAGKVPARKQHTACMTCRMPGREQLVGVVDCTAWNSATNALVFGSHGVYGHNPWYAKQAGNFFVPYKFIDPQQMIVRKQSIHIGLNQWLDLSTAAFESEDLAALIETIAVKVFDAKPRAAKELPKAAADDDDEEDDEEYVALSMAGERSVMVAALPPGLEGENVHKNIKCDCCSAHPIVGTRYQATDVDNYDVCQKCIDKVQNKHKWIVHTVAKDCTYATEDELRRLFDMVDEGKTGELSRTDFVRVVGGHKSCSPERADAVFTKVAKDNKITWSGFVDDTRNDRNGLHRLLSEVWATKQED